MQGARRLRSNPRRGAPSLPPQMAAHFWDPAENHPGHSRGTRYVHTTAAHTAAGVWTAGTALTCSPRQAKLLVTDCIGSCQQANAPPRAQHFPPDMGGRNRRLMIWHGRRLPRPGMPVVRLDLLIFNRGSSHTHIGHKLQGGSDDQRSGALCPPRTSAYFCPQNGHLGPHLHSRG